MARFGIFTFILVTLLLQTKLSDCRSIFIISYDNKSPSRESRIENKDIFTTTEIKIQPVNRESFQNNTAPQIIYKDDKIGFATERSLDRKSRQRRSAYVLRREQKRSLSSNHSSLSCSLAHENYKNLNSVVNRIMLKEEVTKWKNITHQVGGLPNHFIHLNVLRFY